MRTFRSLAAAALLAALATITVSGAASAAPVETAPITHASGWGWG
ncbi:hypothetical protein [Phycicoccus mangrovi]|nr:hypothetical protein [Phycicoccus mangrovi]